ncbi:MAG: DUF4403 family protein [Novosphingobium sp.]|nr:DUF4403 family protein [Novosphingobium sp.]MCP5403944.1 DUF4403 family protein [Novosphingobium sp.]
MVRIATGLLISLLLLGGCNSQYDHPAPPRVTAAPKFPSQDSTLAVPISLSLDEIQAGLERRTPRKLWSIDERRENCVPAQRIKAFGGRIKVTPDIGCRIVGQVTRGRIRLSGSGQRITITLPVNAVLSARDVGGVLKSETADGSATVRADVRLSVDRNWNPHAKVDISYGWTEPPGIDFLGQRIRFVKRADKELAKVVSGLERDLQKEIAKVRIRPVIADAWKEGFTVIELNREKPPAWMRVTPSGLGFSGYRVAGRRVELVVAAQAVTETFVGDKPAMPVPTPLPPQLETVQNSGLRFFIPVVADYTQLEPVVLRALRKLAARGIRLEGVGRVDAKFEKVTIYATSDNRLAVGIEAQVEPVGERFGTRFGKSHGRIWLTGTPVSTPNSQVIRVRDLEIFGGADRMAADLLIQLMLSDKVKEEIATSLTEDFSEDYDKVLEAARRAIANRREGDFRLSATIDDVNHDLVQVTGAGLFLRVAATGKGQILYSPR